MFREISRHMFKADNQCIHLVACWVAYLNITNLFKIKVKYTKYDGCTQISTRINLPLSLLGTQSHLHPFYTCVLKSFTGGDAVRKRQQFDFIKEFLVTNDCVKT